MWSILGAAALAVHLGPRFPGWAAVLGLVGHLVLGPHWVTCDLQPHPWRPGFSLDCNVFWDRFFPLICMFQAPGDYGWHLLCAQIYFSLSLGDRILEF